MDRWVTPPKRVTSPTWGPPPLCKQALRTNTYRNSISGIAHFSLSKKGNFTLFRFGITVKRRFWNYLRSHSSWVADLSQVDITTVNRSVRHCAFSSFIFVNKYSLRFGLLAHFIMTSFACLLLLFICSPGVDRWSIGVATSLTRGVKSITSWVSLKRLP